MREELAEEAYFDQSDEEEPPSPRTPGSPQRSSRSPSPLDAASLPREDVEAEVVAAKLRSPTHESSSSPNLADSTALPAMPFLELPEGTADTESDVAAPEQPHKKVRRT